MPDFKRKFIASNLRVKPRSRTASFFFYYYAMFSLESYVENFLDESLRFKGNTQQTIRGFKNILDCFLKYSFAKTLDDLNRVFIKQYIFKRSQEKKWSPKTIKNHLITLSLFCDWLVQEEFITSNPVKTITKPKQKKMIRPFLSVEQAENLLECARLFKGTYSFERPRAYAIVATFLFTGVRKSELLNIQMDHLLWEQEDLIIKQGKGQKDRIIPLNSRYIDILRYYLSERERKNKQCPYLFTSLRYHIPMGTGALQRLFLKLKNASGMDVYPHLLRHTFATQLLQNGVPLPNVSHFLGHANIQSTIPYAHAATSHFRAGIAKLPY